MKSSFSAKQLRVTFILAPENSNGVFPGTNSNTLVLTGNRIIASVQTVPGVATRADVKIFGMRQADMNALTTIFFNSNQKLVYNQVIVEANSGNGYAKVFDGMVTEGQPEYKAAPNVYFNLQGIVGYQHQITAIPPRSYRGSVGAAAVLGDIAAQMGLALETSGTLPVISNPYLPGTAMDQLKRICAAGGLQFVIAGGTLAVYLKGGLRTAPPVVELNPSNGLIGYPTLQKYGVVLESLYNPALQAGGQIRVTGSQVPNANGLWSPNLVDHQLEGNVPGGAWMTVSQCIPVRS